MAYTVSSVVREQRRDAALKHGAQSGAVLVPLSRNVKQSLLKRMGLRQKELLHYAVRVKLLDENPAVLVPNPEPKRREVLAFETVSELEIVSEELHPTFAPIPVFAGLTGLRPEEWIALERRDVDTRNGIVHVRRVFTDGELKPYGKQTRSLRAVPLPVRASRRSRPFPRGSTPRCCSPPRRAHT